VPADPDVGEKEGGVPADTGCAGKADGNRVDVSKSPSVAVEHKGDSTIPESSATGDNNFTDGPRLKADR